MKAFFAKHLSHLLSYAGHALGAFAAIDPTGLDPRVRLAIGVAGLITTAADHGYKAGSDALKAAVGAAVSSATASVAVAKPAALALVLTLLCVVGVGSGVTGCASVQSFLGSPTGTEVVTAAVDIAVATAEAKGISAVQINTIAKKAVAANSSATATLAAVSAVVQSEVQALHLPAGDQAAADILISALSAAIQAKVGTSTALATAQADAAVVLQAVVAATGG